MHEVKAGNERRLYRSYESHRMHKIQTADEKQMKKAEKLWDKVSKTYDKEPRSEIKIVARVKKYLKIDDIVLDYGCATGTVDSEIAGIVKKVHGIDISSKMIAAAKRKIIEQKIDNIDFTQSTLFDERLKKESFHVVLTLYILHLLEDIQNVMERINDLVKPGGLFISITPCMGEKKSFLSIFLSLLIKIGIIPYIKFFKITELDDLILNANFRAVETKIFFENNQPFYFIVAKKK